MRALTPMLTLVLSFGCRGERYLLCDALQAERGEDGIVQVHWAECSDGVDRDVFCEPADPRYLCDCFEDGVLVREDSLSDDIEDALVAEDPDALRASSNAACAWDIVPR